VTRRDSLVAAIVLAAGFARRMGRQKLLLELRGKPVVLCSVETILPHVGDVIVVTGQDDAGVRAALAGLPVRFAVNPRPQDGQGSSIAVGMAALKPWTAAVLIALGDQPRLPDGLVARLLGERERTGKAIVTPVFQGTQGTPVLFAADVFNELRALVGDAGARSVVQARPERVARVEVDAPMPPDVDTPEDYARLHVQ
jgi:molybdenum cofactor cytidylyltransferase